MLDDRYVYVYIYKIFHLCFNNMFIDCKKLK
jgi:hypothetical protein